MDIGRDRGGSEGHVSSSSSILLDLFQSCTNAILLTSDSPYRKRIAARANNVK